jgi:arylsulfatase A-like enzyme
MHVLLSCPPVPSRRSPLSRRAAVTFVFAMLAVACSRDEGGDARVVFKNASVVLITLDTTRVDHLSCYGYERKTTPNLDRFAAECVKFEMAFSQSSFTPPSHASMMTGRYPSSHGLTWWDTRLPDSVPTLAEVLRDAGRKTAMFSPLAMGKPETLNLGKGCDRILENDYFKFKLPIPGQTDYPIPPGNLINDAAFGWLKAIGESPFYSWVHYYDAHRPFAIFTQDRPFVTESDRASRFGDDTNGDYQLDPAERAARKIGDKEAQYLIDRYDSGLLDLDKKLAVMLDHLRTSGILDRAIVVITADHGEAFAEFEAEWFTHDPFLYDPVTHVPLLIRFPQAKFGGKVVTELVELIDIMPTVLDYVAVETPPVQGFSLRPLIESDQRVNDYVGAERSGQWREPDEEWNKANPGQPKRYRDLPPEKVGARRSLRWKQDRLVVETATNVKTLYATDGKKGETPKPLDPESRSGKGQLEHFEHFLKRLAAVRPEVDLRGLDPATIEQLKQLGYID